MKKSIRYEFLKDIWTDVFLEFPGKQKCYFFKIARENSFMNFPQRQIHKNTSY